MSFRPAPSRKKRSSQSPSKPAIPRLVPTHEAQVPRRPYGATNLTILPRSDLYEPSGSFLQNLPTRSETLVEEHITDTPIFHSTGALIPPAPNKTSNKKIKQWARWANEVIPALLAPYVTILQESDSLRHFEPSDFTCPCPAAKLNVICVYFERNVYCDYKFVV